MSFLSGLQSALVERRVPYRLAKAWDIGLIALGAPEKQLEADGLTFRVRRGTCDEDFVRLVVRGREYLPPGISLSSSDTVIDIGGNIGTFAVLAATLARQVIVAEPDVDNLRLLRTNLGLNAVEGKVHVHPVAVTGESGPVTFYACSHGGGFHTIVPGYRTNAVEHTVRGVTLADLCAMHGLQGCDLLKLDCEGAEFGILDTMPRSLRIRQIAMEYHLAAKPEADVLAWAQERGYKIVAHERFPNNAGGHLFLTSDGRP